MLEFTAIPAFLLMRFCLREVLCYLSSTFTFTAVMFGAETLRCDENIAVINRILFIVNMEETCA